MRENRQYGSEGGEPQTNAAFLPLSPHSRVGRLRHATLAGRRRWKPTRLT
jgi:hypothetical protein